MANVHSKTFFGQKTGLMIKSNSKNEPFIYFICFKKKINGTWEKPSKGAGKIVKCSLEEMAIMLDLLNKKRFHWHNYHDYNKIKTGISFEWENKECKRLWIIIGKYRRCMDLGEIKIMALLLEHLLEEKIINATCPPKEKKFSELENQKPIEKLPKIENLLKSPHFREKTKIEGKIKKETKKAFLIRFRGGKEIWVPKSTIHNDYSFQTGDSQEFLIDNWILEKNKLIS